MATDIDLSSVPSDQRVDALTKAFNDIDPEDSLEISSNDNFFQAMADFQKQLWGKYNWAILKAGPTVWKGQIAKRKEEESAPRWIGEFMPTDHRRCDKLYADGEAAGIKGDWEKAKELLSAFELGMRRHFAMEETVFFPAFEEDIGTTQGPTQVMRMEHEQMKGALNQMKDAIGKNDNDAILGVGETLLILMQQHNMKEEQMLYQMADMHISPADDLLKKMELVEV